MFYGYARVSTPEQRLDRQVDQLTAAGVAKENIFQEKMTGTKRDRPELNRMLSSLKEGDTVIIADLTRVSRSTKDLLEIVDTIKDKGAYIKSLKDSWLDTTSDNPYNTFLLTVMSGLSQLERDLTSTRVREGLAAAAKRGKRPGRPSKVKAEGERVRKMKEEGLTVKEISTGTGLSRSTVNRILGKQR